MKILFIKMVWITLPSNFDEDSKQWVRHDNIPRMQNIIFNKNSILDYSCALNVESLPHKTVRATSIACNIGYILNRDVESLLKMMQAGMNIARIHLSLKHEDLEYHSQTVKNIREAAEIYSKILGVPYPVAIASNTIGCQIRTGYLEGGEEAEIELIAGNLVKLTTDPAFKDKCSAQVIFIDNEDVTSRVVPGRIIYIDDGEIKLELTSIAGAFLTCKILIGGKLGNQRGINLPGTKIDLPALSETDKLYIDFAIENNLDFLFCAYIKSKSAVLEIRKALGKKGKHIKLISKIEDALGYQNLEEIISVSDAVLVARGDLYLEYSCQKLFISQKYISALCAKHGCPVIISREFIESMITERIPTRAEVCDVAHAVLDGADVIMLARETIKGYYSKDIVQFVSQICKEAESIAWRSSHTSDWKMDADNIRNALAMTAVDSSIKCRAAAILVITDTGRIAKIISKYRPRCPIVAITRYARVSRQLNIYKSVIPFLYIGEIRENSLKDIDKQVAAVIEFGKNRLFIHSNDPLIIIVDYKHNSKFNNSMRIQYVSEELDIVDDDLVIS